MEKDAVNEQFVSTREACRLLDLTRARVSQIARERGWKPVRDGRGRSPAVYRLADVLAYQPKKGGRPKSK